jgi:trk system potassium uptake protein TrkA
MRVAIAGAGAVGRSIGRELLDNGHQVMLIDRDPEKVDPSRVPRAEWLQADAAELASLEEARMQDCDVVISATGDDKVNLVVSLLAKTEFAVRRVVARINHPNNEWLFTEAWGVDVAVSTPRVLAALVEEAVSVGDLVRLMTFRQGQANLVEITLSDTAPVVGKAFGDVHLPRDAALVAIVRGARVVVPTPDEPLEAGDELLFVAVQDVEPELRTLVCGDGTC